MDLTGKKGLIVGIVNEHSIASDAASAITGTTQYVDGGFHILN